METRAKQNGEAIKRRLNEFQEFKKTELSEQLKREKNSIMDEINPNIRTCVRKLHDLEKSLGENASKSSQTGTLLETRIKDCKAEVTRCVQLHADTLRTVEKLREPKDAEVASLKGQVKLLRDNERTIDGNLDSCVRRTESNSSSITDIRGRLNQLYKKSGTIENMVMAAHSSASASTGSAQASVTLEHTYALGQKEQLTQTDTPAKDTATATMTEAYQAVQDTPKTTETKPIKPVQSPPPPPVPAKNNSDSDSHQLIPVLVSSSGSRDGVRGSAPHRPTSAPAVHRDANFNTNNSWFGGVVKNRVERYYVGHIDPNSNEAGIRAYIQDQGIHVTFLRLMQSQMDNTLSAQVNVAATDTSRCLLERGFWPKGIRCREWKPRSQWLKQEP